MHYAHMQHVVHYVQVGGMDFGFEMEAAADQPLQTTCTVIPSLAEGPNRSAFLRATLGEGLYTTLCSAVARLAAQHPDLLIELRNNYTNFAGRGYGNLSGLRTCL
jgi:hypothetical protein